ncbi:MAG: site-2 protease family protein [Ruminococcus sp.]|nr:site-2 protease family protein [Ruminococcus sp.]
MVNLFLGIFNMLPVLSLDGGQILHLLLSRKIEDIKAQKAVNILTFIFIFPLAVLGFILLFKTKYNFSLLAVCLYLILSLIFKRDNFD